MYLNDILGSITIENIKEVGAGSITYLPGGTYGPRVQQGLQIVTLLSGSLTLTVNRKLYKVEAGSTVILVPGGNEFFAFDTRIKTRHEWVYLDMFAGSYPNFLETGNFPAIIPLSKELSNLIPIIISVKARGGADAADQLLLKQLGFAFLHLCMADAAVKKNELAEPPIIRLTEIIMHERMASADINLSDIAGELGVSNEHLIREFKKFRGITPMKYLWGKRIELALDLLRNSGMRVSEIAEKAGYASLYHFSKRFKQFTGKSPTEIRKDFWRGGL